MDGGLISFVTAYHKGYEYSEKTKLIQRFLPKEVGELLVYYLWLVLPFFETMQLVVDKVDGLSAFIWGDEKSYSKEGDDITKDRAEGTMLNNEADDSKSHC